MEGSLSSSHLSRVVDLPGKPPDAMADDRPESQAPSCDRVAAGGLMKASLGLGECCKQREKDRLQMGLHLVATFTPHQKLKLH